MTTIELIENERHDLTENTGSPWVSITANVFADGEPIPIFESLPFVLGGSYPARLRHKGFYEVEKMARLRCQNHGITVHKVIRI